MDLNPIYMQLATLLHAIDRELTKLLPAASLPLAASAAHESLGNQLGQWENQLEQLARILSSERHALSLQERQISALPRDARYTARQSVTDRTRNVDVALKDLALVRARLDALFDRFGRPTGTEILKALEKLTAGTFKEVKLTQAATRELQSLTAKPSGQVLRSPSPGTAPDLLVSLAVVGRLLHILALRLLKRSKRED